MRCAKRRASEPSTSVRAARALSYLARRAPVRHAVVVALPPRPDPRPAARARPPDPAIDLLRRRAAVIDRGAHQLGGGLERTPPLVLARRPRAGATARAAPPRAPRPATCSRSRRRATGRAAPRRTSVSRPTRAGGRASRRSAAAARGCPARAGAIARVCSSSTGPFQRTASAARRAARATACRVRRSPRGPHVQRPVSRRCERRTRPPSKRSSRFLPCAVTDSSTLPSIRSAIAPDLRARDAATRPRPAGRRSPAGARAARWRVSPSGTLPR